MDGNNGQSETGVDAMAKLEEDLQKLTNETDTAASTSQPVDSQLDNEVVVPPQEPVEVTESIVETTTPPEVTPNPIVPPEPKKGSPMLIISLGLVVVALLVAIAYVIGIKFFSGTPKQIACTAEAKVCEDGTSVGRSGPNCEFDACPVVSTTPEATPDPTVSWKSYSDNKIGLYLKFPPQWVLKVGETNGTTGGISFDTTIPSTNKNTNYIFGFNLEQQSNFDEWSKYATTKKLDTETINGQSFDKYITADLYNSLNYILKQDGKLYRLSIYPYEESTYPSEVKDDVYQLLSSFKINTLTPSGSPTSTPSSLPVY